jgi:hypothetical protein
MVWEFRVISFPFLLTFASVLALVSGSLCRRIMEPILSMLQPSCLEEKFVLVRKVCVMCSAVRMEF